MFLHKMSNSSLTVKQVGYNWVKGNESPILCGKQNKFDEPEDHCSHFRKSKESCDFSSRSSAFPSSEQDTKIWTHFGPHLLNNFNIGLDFKTQNPSEEHRLNTSEKIGGVNIKKDKEISKDAVFPFCKELLKTVKPDQMTRRFRTNSSVVPRKAHTDNFKWRNQKHQKYFSFYGEVDPGPQESTRSSTYQTPHILTQFQSNEAATQHFRKLGLSVQQMMGLEYLGVHVSKFLPRPDVSAWQDPRIPPRYDVDGTSCYWCETRQHVAYGVAFLLKEDVRVIGVALQMNRTSSKVALIQISTVDVILLIAMNPNRFYAPTAINILFRDSEIFKVGVKIEKTLRALWEEFQIESNSYVELEQLLLFSNEKFGSFSSVFKSPLKLRDIASALGYEDWGATELIFSSWDSRPLSSKQIQYVARNALVCILLFWSIAMGRVVSNASFPDLKVNVKQFVDSVCIYGPISKSYKNIPLIPDGLGINFGELSSSNQRSSYIYK